MEGISEELLSLARKTENLPDDPEALAAVFVEWMKVCDVSLPFRFLR